MRHGQARRETSLQALRDVTFALQRGQTFGVIGRNGAGKSTLLKLVSGIYRPDHGRVAVHGKVGALLELGAGFHPEFSGRENILINGVILGLSKREVRRRFDAIVRFAELEDFIDEPVKTYSSGMYARLGFAVMVHADLDLLLIDEILAVGDEAFQLKCFDRIEQWQRQGKTIVLVSHTLSMIERWCDEVLWLEEGIVRDRGTPHSIIERFRQTVSAKDRQNGVVVSPNNGTSSIPPQSLDSRPDRWGNHDVEIISTRLHDATGAERCLFRSGDQAHISVCYRVRRHIEAPQFRLVVLRSDGLWCYGMNSPVDCIPLSSLAREGTVEVLLEQLHLPIGTYYLDVAVEAGDGMVCDYHHRMYSFAVTAGAPQTDACRITHHWVIRPSISGAERSVVSD